VAGDLTSAQEYPACTIQPKVSLNRLGACSLKTVPPAWIQPAAARPNWTGSAESGEGYFQGPGTPHSETSSGRAMRIWDLIEAVDLLIPSEARP